MEGGSTHDRPSPQPRRELIQIARYREKAPDDLVWNRIRRQITRDLDTRIQNLREEMLNKLLTTAFDQFVSALETGTVIQLEDEATRWVDDVLATQLAALEAGADGDVEHG